MKMLFWNTHRNGNINSYIFELVEQNEIDILILAEYASDNDELSKCLIQSKKRLYKWNSTGCNRIQIWGNYVDVKPGEQNKYFSIQIINNKYIICGVHMYSDLNGERFDERISLAEEIRYAIKNTREELNSNDVIIIGDMNESPYEKACLSAKGFHALPALKILGSFMKKNMKRCIIQCGTYLEILNIPQEHIIEQIQKCVILVGTCWIRLL